ncbi:Uncharacterised protein r2_g991 [Pycnogonum litorale]
MKDPQSKELEEAVFKWYMQQRSVKVNVRGVELMAAAQKLAQHMGIEFKASTGWLWRFRNRHGVCNKVEHGEAGSADTTAVEPYRLKGKFSSLQRTNGFDGQLLPPISPLDRGSSVYEYTAKTSCGAAVSSTIKVPAHNTAKKTLCGHIKKVGVVNFPAGDR